MKRSWVPIILAVVLAAAAFGVLLPTPVYAACSNPGFGHCVRDEFSSQAYNLNAGDQNWNGNWAETSDDDSASGGAILVTSNALRLQNICCFVDETGRYIQRSKTIPAGYTSATLEFVLDENANSTSDQVQLLYSTNGGSTFTTVTYNGSSTDGTKTFTLGDVAGQTVVVRFRIASDLSLLDGDWFSVDNVEIRYSTPLAVTLASFTADAAADGVTLAWETVSEQDNAGFNVYRGETAEGPWAQANAVLIPAAAPGSSEGHSYIWVDPVALSAGQTAFYLLEDLDFSGAAVRHGPVSVSLAAPHAVPDAAPDAAPAAAPDTGPNAIRLTGLTAAVPAVPAALPLAGLGLVAAAFVLRRRR